MKRHKAPGLPGLSAEMITLHKVLELSCYWIYVMVIVKEGGIPEDWKSSVILPIYKGKGDPTECGSYWGLNCWNMVSKCWKGSLNTEFGSRLG